jgi:hypothetical protein
MGCLLRRTFVAGEFLEWFSLLETRFALGWAMLFRIVGAHQHRAVVGATFCLHSS